MKNYFTLPAPKIEIKISINIKEMQERNSIPPYLLNLNNKKKKIN